MGTVDEVYLAIAKVRGGQPRAILFYVFKHLCLQFRAQTSQKLRLFLERQSVSIYTTCLFGSGWLVPLIGVYSVFLPVVSLQSLVIPGLFTNREMQTPDTPTLMSVQVTRLLADMWYDVPIPDSSTIYPTL